jgi:hypothetical protein
MKAKNNEDVYKAVLHFSYYLTGSIVLAVCIFSAFMKTSSVEVNRILEKTEEYDLIQMKQANLTESMDTLYFYTSLLNSDPIINRSLMYNVLSSRKIEMLNEIETMDEKDCLLYKRVAGQMDVFFAIKDSIGTASSEEETVRADLIRCISDNKQMARRLSIGGLTVN